MKLSKLFAILATATLLITGCSKKGKTGTKTDYDSFKQTVNNLPSSHPYLYATIKYSDKAAGTVYDSGTEECKYQNGTWNSNKSSSESKIWYITNNRAQDVIDRIENGYLDLETNKATFYVNPVSINFSSVSKSSDYEMKEDDTLIWDDYGLLTYGKYVISVSGISEVMEISISYRTKDGGGGSGGGSGQGKKEVTQSEFLNSFNDNHPYRRAHLSLSSTVGESAEIDYEYTDGTWVAQDTSSYVSLNAMIAENYIPSMGALAEQGYEIHYYTNPYLFVIKVTESGSTVEMQIEYNQYGLPVNGVETYSSQGQSGRATFTVTYSF